MNNIGFFSSTNQPRKKIGGGRVPNEISRYLKANKPLRITPNQVLDIYRSIIFTKTVGQLEDMVSEKNRSGLPALVMIVISSTLKDIASGNMNNLDTMLQRCFGKMDFTLAALSDEEKVPETVREREIAKLERELKMITGDDIFLSDKLFGDDNIKQAEDTQTTMLVTT